MERKDIILIAALVALMIAWPVIDRHVIKPVFFPKSGTEAIEGDQPSEAAEPPGPGPAGEAPVLTEPVAPETVIDPAPAPAEVEPAPEPEPAVPEQLVTLENERMAVVVSSRGGGVISATLKDYRASLEPASGPVVLDFESLRALTYKDFSGFTASSGFEVTEESARRVVLERASSTGLKFRRTLDLGDGYVLQVTDEVENAGGEQVEVGAPALQLGVMRNMESGRQMRGVVYLGVDTLSPGGEGVRHWSRRLGALFEEVQRAGRPRKSAWLRFLRALGRLVGMGEPEPPLPRLPVQIDWPHENPVDWVAAKNKYFVQILRPEEGGESCGICAAREVAARELEDPGYQPRMTPLTEVSASIVLPGQVLQPGERAARRMHYYVGPKKYDELAALGFHQAEVMEFGMWPWLKAAMLKTMNGIYRVIPSYGVAIILLTIIVRVLFWPITHKSTESMKRMAEIQPLVNELRAKYKENPQKQQQEIMALYKEHKVNPLGGCLPMLVQIPVFIALFVVLRSAIELRFAPFLWVKDLSEPENLFAGMIPLVGSLNIIPIIMAATMFWQQKLTPSAGDPQQQKMMAFMPIMMLVFFYNFASGLALYWTTNQCLMIAQQLIQKRRKAVARAG
ncbi:MAG: membrane protein insertase YidC [Kiritimatiellae bacterium]|nr:membrane protein insertase YidC [Kiritimatiellia bacterium]